MATEGGGMSAVVVPTTPTPEGYRVRDEVVIPPGAARAVRLRTGEIVQLIAAPRRAGLELLHARDDRSGRRRRAPAIATRRGRVHRARDPRRDRLRRVLLSAGLDADQRPQHHRDGLARVRAVMPWSFWSFSS